jgi:hypothetical protein
MKKFAMIWGIFAMLVASPAIAQPLADRVPDDAVIYIGWQGTRAMGDAYAQSHLNGIIKDANLSLSLDRAITMMAQAADREQPGAGKIFALWQKLGQVGWEHPWAFYFGGVEFNGRDQPPTPHVALLIDAGKDANAVTAMLNTELAQAMPGGPQELANAPFAVTSVGSMVVIGSKNLAQDAPKLAALLNGGNGKTIKADPTFTNALAKVPAGSVAVAYINAEKLLAMVDQAVVVSEDPQALQMWPKIREATGLAGLKRVVWGGNFVGRKWESITYVQAPAPRRGLIKLLDAKPLSKEAVGMIPSQVSWASAMNIDIAGLYDELLVAVEKIEPGASMDIKAGIADASQEVGIDVEKNLIRAIGSEWVTYSDANAAAFMGLGFTIANRTKNAEAVGQLLTHVETMANGMAPPDQPQVQSMQQGDLKVYFTPVAMFSPSWALHNGNLYISMTPQGVTAAAQRGSKAEGSILENAAFAEQIKDMKVGDQYTQIAFTDLEKTVPQTYQTLQMGLGMAAQQMPEAGQVMAMLPPLGALMPHLSPVTSASWSDEGGVYLRSFGPFPGAANLGSGVNPQQLMMFGGIGAAAAMWTQMGRPNHMGQDHGPGMIEVVPNAPN